MSESMNSRRKFLQMLGFGAVAAPFAASVGISFPTAELVPAPTGLVPSLLELQAEINRRHSARLFQMGDRMFQGVIIRETSQELNL